MPRLSRSYCGVPWYFANSACQSASESGGIAPVTGRHSVIDRPEPVSRVSPPTSTISAIMRGDHEQPHTPRLDLSRSGRPCSLSSRQRPSAPCRCDPTCGPIPKRPPVRSSMRPNGDYARPDPQHQEADRHDRDPVWVPVYALLAMRDRDRSVLTAAQIHSWSCSTMRSQAPPGSFRSASCCPG